MESLIDAKFPDDVLEFVLPEALSEKSSAFKSLYKSMLISRYIDENGYLPDLGDLMEDNEVKDHVQNEVNGYVKPFSMMSRDAAIALDKLRKETDVPGLKSTVPEGGSDYGSSDDSSDSDSGGGDDFGGDFGFDEPGGDEGESGGEEAPEEPNLDEGSGDGNEEPGDLSNEL